MATAIDLLQAQLRDQALGMGAAYFGVADLRPVKSFITRQGDDFLGEFPTGVSIGFPLADGVVDLIYDHYHREVPRLYRHHVYTAVGGYLERTATAVAFRLEQEGYRALPTTTFGQYLDVRTTGVFSDKLTAHLAGLGWIGKNCLMMTKQHGPRTRWISVLTDAPLSPTGHGISTDHCKNCRLCVELCPVQAFHDVAFDPADPVEVRFDTAKCARYLRGREETIGAIFCGLCVYVCPHGWSAKRKKGAPRLTPALLRERLLPVVRAESGGEAAPAGAADGPPAVSTHQGNGRKP